MRLPTLQTSHTRTYALAKWTGIGLAACLSLTACGIEPLQPVQPEAGSGLITKRERQFSRQAVAAANPLATEAGARILREGGNAVDAAVAVQMVLTLVEPQSSGIGGGAFLLHFDGRNVQAYDGRETAPAAATPELFVGKDGKPMAFMDAVVGGRSVGVPGTVRMLELAHRENGKLPWAQLFAPAIELADQGFEVSPRLFTLLSKEMALQADPVARAYFYQADGQPHPVGHRLKNPALASILRQIADKGSQALHQGPIADAIVAKVTGHRTNPGAMQPADLKQYQALKREALCFDHTAAGRPLHICGFPPPSSGALAVGQIMGLMARLTTSHSPWQGTAVSPSWLHRYTEASRLAFADRAQYVGDPAFVAPPAGRWTSLLDENYLTMRAQLVSEQRTPSFAPGTPAGTQLAWASMPDQPEKGTSHISIVDRNGHAVAMTTTIEAGFGARLMVSPDPGLPGGFLLNNELTDFSFQPTGADGKPIANRVEGGKRPRSSMAPTLVFDRDTGELVMSTGSPGGAFIIHFVTKTLMGTLQWQMTPQAAIDLPNFGTTGGPLVLEAGRFTPGLVQTMKALGHPVVETDLTSGLQAIQRVTGPDGNTVWSGGADPRREGIVLGD